MRRVMLEVFEDDNTGELGFGLLDMPRHEQTNAATEGALVAHDLIEHVNGPALIGTIDDELEALGAIWYVRGQHNEMFRAATRSNYTVYENIGSDIARMFRDYIEGGQHVDYSPIRARRTRADDALLNIVAAGTKMWRGEFGTFDSDESESEIAQQFPGFADIAFKRMQIGCAKARSKWERHGPYAACETFYAIADAVNPVLKQIEIAGQRALLRYDLMANATCELLESNDYV